jgi:hypothetical protein
MDLLLLPCVFCAKNWAILRRFGEDAEHDARITPSLTLYQLSYAASAPAAFIESAQQQY